MKIDFYIPKDQVIPTRLRLKVDGKDVYYKRLSDCFGYEFEFFSATEAEAMEMTLEIARIMCVQSYDHGAEWRVTSIYHLRTDEAGLDDHQITRVKFRVRDAG